MTFDQMDQNHDGSLTPDEIPAGDPLRRDFQAVDANGDGKLSAEEVDHYRAARGALSGPAAGSPAN